MKQAMNLDLLFRMVYACIAIHSTARFMGVGGGGVGTKPKKLKKGPYSCIKNASSLHTTDKNQDLFYNIQDIGQTQYCSFNIRNCMVDFASWFSVPK